MMNLFKDGRSMRKFLTCVVTYEGSFLIEVNEKDLRKLDTKEPGTFITAYNVRNARGDFYNVLHLQKEMETCSIISRLFTMVAE